MHIRTVVAVVVGGVEFEVEVEVEVEIELLVVVDVGHLVPEGRGEEVRVARDAVVNISFSLISSRGGAVSSVVFPEPSVVDDVVHRS